MPIEETGNLLLMIAYVAKATGNMDFVYPQYWDLLTEWANYLVNTLPDPGDQLCTDDFEGPTPHDANLAVKGIIAIDSFSILNQMLGNQSGVEYYHDIAFGYAKAWMAMANPDSKDHYRLEYDKPGWSLKYNLLYQYLLKLHTFPSEVFNTELSFYAANLSTYGIPLDNRHDYTKLDWESWVAAMYSDKSELQAFMDSLYNFANETPNRVPLSDWYHTTDAWQAGFQARPVVGGVFAAMTLQHSLQDPTPLSTKT